MLARAPSSAALQERRGVQRFGQILSRGEKPKMARRGFPDEQLEAIAPKAGAQCRIADSTHCCREAVGGLPGAAVRAAPGPCLALSLLALTSAISAQADARDVRRDGQLLSREACTMPGSAYEEYRQRTADQWRKDEAAARALGLAIRPLDQFLAALPSEDEYLARKAYKGFQCERLVYASDGLRVVAYLWRPVQLSPSSGRLPLILFNRGGYGEEFKLRPNTWFGFYNYLRAGYAVLGSQYRGNDGGEGRDELAGADVRDVLNLIPLSRELGFPADSPRYAIGFSRGALMTLKAMRQGLSVRAAAVVGAPADLTAVLAQPQAKALIAQRIPDFDADPEAALRERSPLLHVDAVGRPLLILHGTADAAVPARDALRLTDALLERNAPVSLVLFDGDTHGTALNGAERDRHILAWFAEH